MNQDQWDKYIWRFKEPSDRHWKAEETPIGEDKDGTQNLAYLVPCERVLDIGCGHGHAMARLKEMGKKVVGLDISGINVGACLEVGLDARMGDMHTLPFADNSQDGILMWDIFEHAMAPIIVLWECGRVLTDSGRMIVYTPPENWADHPVHVIIPTPNQMKFLAKMGGFDIEHQREMPRAKGMLYHLKRDVSLDRKRKIKK